MNISEGRPRFRGGWAVPAAFLATVATVILVVLLELVGLAMLLGADDLGSMRDISNWLLPIVSVVAVSGVTLFGLPTWMAMHLLGAVHPGHGALVGAVMGAVAAGVLFLVLLSGADSAGVFALFGVLPGAAGGAICLWVAYRP